MSDETGEKQSHNPLVRYFKVLGPGLVTGASDDDPSGIITCSMAGVATGARVRQVPLQPDRVLRAIQQKA